MDKLVKMIPIENGIIYILGITNKEITFKFCYYGRKSASFKRCVDIVEVEEGILLQSLGNHICIPYTKAELIQDFANKTANDYFK